MTSTSTSVFFLHSKVSQRFILGPVIITTCYRWWIPGLMSELSWGSLIATTILPTSSLIPVHAQQLRVGLSSRTSSALLNPRREMNDCIFHGVSVGLSLHQHNMKGYSRGFLPLGIWSCKNLQPRVSPPPSSFDSPICLAWSSLFIWLTTAISTVVVQFIYSSDSKPILQPG